MSKIYVLGNKNVGITLATVDGLPAIILNNDPNIAIDYKTNLDNLSDYEVAIVFKSEEERQATMESLMPNTKFQNVKDHVYKYEVHHMEHEPGWGTRVDERRYYASEKAAKDHVQEFNSKNGDVKSGGWWMSAHYHGN